MANKIFNYVTILIILATLPLYWMLFNLLNLEVNWMTYVGIIILVPSLSLFIIARIQLGNSFQVSAEAKNLVTGGVYKKFRHPIYYFGTLFMLGVILILQAPIVLIMLIAVVVIQKKRIQNEEKVLEEAFGEKYLEYKKRTWF